MIQWYLFFGVAKAILLEPFEPLFSVVKEVKPEVKLQLGEQEK